MYSKFIENDYSLSDKNKAVNTHWIDRMAVKPEELRNNPIETYKKAKVGHQEGLGTSQPNQSGPIQKDTFSLYGAEIAALAEQEIVKALNKQGLKCRTVKSNAN